MDKNAYTYKQLYARLSAMYVSDQKIEEAIRLFEQHNGIMRTSEALKAGIHRRTLYYMRDHDYLEPLERGVYRLADKEPVGNPDLVIIGSKIPEARICLVSALSIHEITDEIPHKVHIALSRTSRNPILEYPPIRVYRFSDDTLTAGVQTHTIDGVDIKVYNPAKTIADCFKFRNQIGLDIAIAALKQGLSQRKATYGDIIKYARLCRVENIIQPYMNLLGHS